MGTRYKLVQIRAVTVPLIPFPVRFFNKNRGFGSVRFLVTYLPFFGILNHETTNAVNGNINLGYTYISKLLW